MLRTIQAVFARGVSERLRRLIDEPYDYSLDAMLEQKSRRPAVEPARSEALGAPGALRDRIAVSA